MNGRDTDCIATLVGAYGGARAAIVPIPVFYRCLVPIGGTAVTKHQEPIAKVPVDVAPDESVHLVLAGTDGNDVGRRQSRQQEAVRHINAELIAASTPADVIRQPRVEAVGAVPAGCLVRDPRPDKPTSMNRPPPSQTV